MCCRVRSNCNVKGSSAAQLPRLGARTAIWCRTVYNLQPLLPSPLLQGFHHAPSSKDGCVLWVKLRQHGGPSRKHVRLDTKSMPWGDTQVPGVKDKLLYS